MGKRTTATRFAVQMVNGKRWDVLEPLNLSSGSEGVDRFTLFGSFPTQEKATRVCAMMNEVTSHG